MKFFSNSKLWIAAIAVAFASNSVSAQLELGEDCGCPPLGSRTPVNISTLTDANGNLPLNTSFTCDKVYSIDQKVYVQDGGDLYIQPGTVIRGVFGTGLLSNALIVTRGGQIWANGTETCPIIFTDSNDPLDGSYSINIRGQWGGVIILGKATNNLLLANGGSAVADGVGAIEGLVNTDARHYYGGTDDNDNSGRMTYVSLRHGGTNIGANNEINGLTLGSVGRGTVLEHIEVVSNDDDGFEFFGGTVDLKWATAVYCNDDYFDWDQGWRGRGQFWFGLQLPGGSPQGDEGFESDGDDNNSGNLPLADPTIFNVTLIGHAANRGIEAREQTNGYIANSIFANFAAGIEATNEAARPLDSYDNWLAGTFEAYNNSFVGVPTLFTVNAVAASAPDLAAFAADGNIDAPGLIDYAYTIDLVTNNVTDQYNAVPAPGTASTNLAVPNDGFFTSASYRGAFQPGAPAWTEVWTANALLDVASSNEEYCPEDINKDGLINVDDFLQLIGVFNTTCSN